MISEHRASPHWFRMILQLRDHTSSTSSACCACWAARSSLQSQSAGVWYGLCHENLQSTVNSKPVNFQAVSHYRTRPESLRCCRLYCLAPFAQARRRSRNERLKCVRLLIFHSGGRNFPISQLPPISAKNCHQFVEAWCWPRRSSLAGVSSSRDPDKQRRRRSDSSPCFRLHLKKMQTISNSEFDSSSTWEKHTGIQYLQSLFWHEMTITECNHHSRRKFRSQTSDKCIDGKAEVGRVREETSRSEKIREEKEREARRCRCAKR